MKRRWMITRFSIIFCRAPRHPPGKEGVVKMVGIIFHLFLRLLSAIGGEATYVVKMSEWVMVTIEFQSWSSFYPMFTVLHLLCSGVLEKTMTNSWMAHEKTELFLKKYLIRCDRHIMKNLKESFFLWRGVFYRVNQRVMPSTSKDAFYLVLAVTLQKMINIEIIL